MNEVIAARIQQRLDELGLSAREASIKATGSAGTIRMILSGKTANPRSDTLAKLAPVLRTSVQWLMGETETPELERGLIIPGNELVGARDLPVYAGTQGGEGHLIINFEPIDYVKRPAVLEHVKDGYGLYITGESMVPAYRPADTALIHPRLPPARETDVVLFHVPPHGEEAECIIKQLNGWTAREWNLEQFNPPMTFTEARADWPVCHRVVGKYARR